LGLSKKIICVELTHLKKVVINFSSYFFFKFIP